MTSLQEVNTESTSQRYLHILIFLSLFIPFMAYLVTVAKRNLSSDARDIFRFDTQNNNNQHEFYGDAETVFSAADFMKFNKEDKKQEVLSRSIQTINESKDKIMLSIGSNHDTI
ncbi:hypothetical protein FGO68_gene11663 [Halteria grandinella]|uniref:Uncharacterized protein n=1 Tax=Halteria grandinella TaxID=5974 RepID=A0A8J8NHH8_HALGN|nr:hypothetical protein FGO68_gene11663 [Halteria grandinella]